MVKLRFVLVSFFILVTLKSSAQSLTRSVLSATGISSADNNGVLAYSAGELVTGCLVSPSYYLTQGFQQPSMIYIFEDDPNKGINAVKVYPNPVFKELTVLFYTRTINLLYFEMYSAQGVLVKTFEYNISELGWVDIDMENYKSGLYLLHIYSSDKILDRVIKIEKL